MTRRARRAHDRSRHGGTASRHRRHAFRSPGEPPRHENTWPEGAAAVFARQTGREGGGDSSSASGRGARPFSGPARGDLSRAIPTWTGAKAAAVRLPRKPAPSFRRAWSVWDRFSVRLGAVSPSRPQIHLAWRGGPGQGSAPLRADRVAARPLGSVLEAARLAKPGWGRRADCRFQLAGPVGPGGPRLVVAYFDTVRRSTCSGG